MTIPIHALCSNFTEIGQWKWVRRCVVLVTKIGKCGYLLPFCVRLAEVTKSLQESVPVKFRSNRFQFAGVIPKKVIS